MDRPMVMVNGKTEYAIKYGTFVRMGIKWAYNDNTLIAAITKQQNCTLRISY